MDASNRILFAMILFAIALAFVALIFAYPAYHKFLPRRLALGTRIVYLIVAAGLTANGVFAVRGGPAGIGLGLAGIVGFLMLLTVIVHRPWNVRYYHEERDRETEQLRLGPHLLGLDDRSRKL
jgi:disulfide bond formation protein DsbB